MGLEQRVAHLCKRPRAAQRPKKNLRDVLRRQRLVPHVSRAGRHQGFVSSAPAALAKSSSSARCLRMRPSAGSTPPPGQ